MERAVGPHGPRANMRGSVSRGGIVARMVASPVALDPPWHRLGPAAVRALEVHEAHAHAIPGDRAVRDLGDAVLLHDPRDRDPFWNRVAAVRFPQGDDAFEHRLAELFALFAGLDRQPHVWGSPGYGTPADLGVRLQDHGFIEIGRGLTMLLVDPAATGPWRESRFGGSVQLERIRRPVEERRRLLATELALVLAEAFDVRAERRRGLADEVAASFASSAFHAYLVRVDGEPVAAAKRFTFDGASYLSSIGTRPAWRGRGLGGLVSAAAIRDAVAAGSRWTYLGVYEENDRARNLYERLGFAILGEPAADYLLP